MAMVFLAAAALAATPPSPPRPVAAVAQATATIRVISAVRLKLDGAAPNPDAPAPRQSVVKTSDGSVQAAKLIEFQ
jgi:hypothetical protein